MLLLTGRSRKRNQYYMEAVIWETGGAFRTGDIDHDKAKILFEKACYLNHFEACYALSEIYKNEDNMLHATFSDRAMRIDPMKFKDQQERDRVAAEKFARDFKAEIHRSRTDPNDTNRMYHAPDALKAKSDK
jgi:TPR repeat protein